MNLPPRVLAHLARPLRLLDVRVNWIEKWLQIPLSEVEITHVREACAKSGEARLGEYYHWYFQKLMVAKIVRKLDKGRALSLINSTDHTDYSPARNIIESETGVVVAIPHHAHYIFSMIAFAEHLRTHRKVYIFYGQPETNKGNEVFDHLHNVIWGESSNVEVIHDTRQGMADAIKGLKNGHVVIIMPDVFLNENATLALPFCGRPMNVMLGTAALARKTGAWILPLLSTRLGKGIGFQTKFGEPIGRGAIDDIKLSAEAARIADYAVTREMFEQFEVVMGTDILYWQHVRQHLAQDKAFKFVEREALPEIATLLESDPALQPAKMVLDLRTVTVA